MPLLLLLLLPVITALPQSNYADQANNVAYIGEGLPPEAVLGGKVTQLDDLSPEIFLNKTKADLNCAAGSMQIEMKFKEPFYGTVYADFDRNSACQISGNGALKYELELPLKGCGTKQDPQRVFTNNIAVRFHPGLEMEGDEIITIVCRYPPPVVVEPAPFIAERVVAPVQQHLPLSPLPVLLIISGILFLTLFLLGLAASYLCLRRRPVTVIRTITPVESDIEKLSESSLALAPIQESSGSEYPGESPSEIEELPAVQENVSFSSDDYTQEPQVEQFTATPSMIPRLPIAVKEDSPKFDVQVKVKRIPPPSPPPSLTDSKSSKSESIIFPAPIEEEVIEIEEPPQVMATPPPVVVHHPEVSRHDVDDVFLRTIKEKQTIEDVDHHKRQVTEYHTEPKPLPPQIWDVTIKNYPVQPHPPQWEDFSDISSASGLSSLPPREFSLAPQQQIHDDKIPLTAPELVGHLGEAPDRRVVTTDLVSRTTDTTRETSEREEWLRIFNIPKENPEVPNWSVLIRVLQPLEPEEESQVIETAETFNSQLTMTDRIKWRQIITTESTLRTLLTEAVVREDYERISRDVRFRNVFEPPKWNVIIRILTPEDIGPDQSYVFPRRGSLPTVVEYDSDDGSSIREPQLYPSSVYRRSMHRSEADLRSMTEMTVDFGRSSQVTPESPLMSLNRSLSQPSLGRSISEWTERDRWLVPDTPTPEQTPRLQRSPKIKAFHLPRVRLDSGSSTGRGSQAETSWQATETSRMAQTPGGTTTTETTRQVRGAARAKWGKPGRKGWFPDSDSDRSSK